MTLDLLSQTQRAIAQLTDSALSKSELNLTNCDREPIHIPAAIQPHGALLVVNTEDWSIVQLSENVNEYFERSPEQLLNQPLSGLLNDEQIQEIKAYIADESESPRPLRFEIDSTLFSAIAHPAEGYCLLEFEEAKTQQPDFFDFYRLVKCPVVRLQRSQTVRDLQETAVKEIQTLFDFDRVMFYWFDEDGSGNVVTEARRDGMSAFVGLRYPATDIPKQARHLYVLNKLRSIPDITYQPVGLIPDRNPIDNRPLDMSLVGLRSVSPIHTEYLTNMGVRSSMSLSLVRNNRLVGLIACHNNTPKRLSFEQRAICEFLSDVISLEIANKRDTEDADYKIGIKAIQAKFVQTLTASDDLYSGLTRDPAALMALVSATGVAFCDGEQIELLGKTPSDRAVRSLTDWLNNRLLQDVVYQTSALGEVYSPAKDFPERTSGLLALALSRRQNIYVLWFRPETPQVIDWAGNPNKQATVDKQGNVRLSPRQSFDLWKERLEGRSTPWKDCEIEAARELRSAVIGVVLQKAEELTQINTELMRSNVELDSFAYVASHDLKEPLRGIHNYSSFLIEDYGEVLGEDGQEKLHTLMRLTQRMEALINSLLHYSRLGRADLLLEPVDINEVASSAIAIIKISQPGDIQFSVAEDLPEVQGDRTRISELFYQPDYQRH